MPSKIQLDENLWFLYICLQKSDLKTIDFNAVGHATSLKPPAARMRYTRLRRQIESGTLSGTQGTPFASTSASENIAARTSKRKRSGGKRKETTSDHMKKEDDEESGVHGDVNEEDMRKVVKVETEIKKEKSDGYGSEGNTTGWGSDETDSWSSEDEIPLAKLRKVKRAVTHRATNLDNAGLRAKREGTPVRDFQQEVQSQSQLHPRLLIAEEMNGCHYNRHSPKATHGEVNMFPSEPPLHMYPPVPQYAIHPPLPLFGETFGSSYWGPYQAGWYQFEDVRAGWSNSMEPLQGLSGWKPRKSV